MKNLWRNKNNRWIIIGLLGMSLVWLSFDDQIVETVQSWGYQASPVQIPVEEVSQSEIQDSKNSAQVEQEKLAMPAELSDSKYNDLLVAGSKNNPAQKYFAEYRLERERVRGQQVEWLREVVNNPKTAEENRKEAQRRLIAITDNLSKELLLEQMLKAKNYSDAIVFLQPSNVTIIVQAQELTTQDLTKITDLAARTTGKTPQEMVIIPKN